MSHALAPSGRSATARVWNNRAAGLISRNLNRYGGDIRAALSAYNAGSPNAAGTPTDWGDGRPLPYADSVLRHYLRLAGGGAPDPRDIAARVDGLRSAAVAAGTAAPIGDATASAAPFSLSFPPRPQLARIDEHDRRDLAPVSEPDDPAQAR